MFKVMDILLRQAQDNIRINAFEAGFLCIFKRMKKIGSRMPAADQLQGFVFCRLRIDTDAFYARLL